MQPSCTSFLNCLQGIAIPGLNITQEAGLPARIINLFLPAILGIAGFATVIVIIISGLQFVTSGGNPEAAASAKSRLIAALIGFAVIILAFAILQIIDQLFLRADIV